MIAGMTRAKWLTLRIGALWTSIHSGMYVRDPANGFRAFSNDAAKIVAEELTSEREEHASELFDIVSRNRLRISWVPVTVRYHHKGQSPWKAFRIALQTIRRNIFR